MGAVEEAFKKWDITGDGAISKYELHAALTQLGMSEAQVWGSGTGRSLVTCRDVSLDLDVESAIRFISFSFKV